MNYIDAEVAAYMRKLTDRFDEPVLLEMERRAQDNKFPIVGRVVGATLEMLARSIGARRVFEMGSGYGFSGLWFARAVGEGGEVVLTDGNPDNADLAEDYLSRTGLWDRCRFLVGDAVESIQAEEGDFDVVYCDIDKVDYPRAFQEAKKRLRKGGLYLCDNVLWSGRVARHDDDDESTPSIRAHNEAIYADPDFLPSIIPTRDGVMAALKLV